MTINSRTTFKEFEHELAREHKDSWRMKFLDKKEQIKYRFMNRLTSSDGRI